MLRLLQNAYQRHFSKKMFTKWSLGYEEDVIKHAYSAADKVAEATLRHITKSLPENPQIADIGIGTGLCAQQVFDALPCSITGIDFTEDMMAVCLQKEITDLLIKCDAGKDPWPLPPATYDAVISAGLFEYLTVDMAQHFFKESASCLKPNGLMIFTYVPSESGRNNTQFWEGKSGNFLSCSYDPDLIIAAILKYAFTIVEHSEAFAGSVFDDGSSYSYRLVTAQKIG